MLTLWHTPQTARHHGRESHGDPWGHPVGLDMDAWAFPGGTIGTGRSRFSLSGDLTLVHTLRITAEPRMEGSVECHPCHADHAFTLALDAAEGLDILGAIHGGRSYPPQTTGEHIHCQFRSELR